MWGVVSALSLSFLITVSDSGHGGLLTARVVRGTVTSEVSAIGSLRAISEQGLGFPEGGRLTELDVSVGDQVRPGQILARIDNTAQQVLLRKAKDEVTKQQALLDQIKASNQAEGSVAELNRQRDLLAVAEQATVQTDRSDAAVIAQDQRELEFDRADLRRQLKQLEIDQQQCDQSKILGTSTTVVTVLPNGNSLTLCEDAENRRDLVADAQRRIVQDEAAIDLAQKKRDLDRTVQQSVIDLARLNVTVAENKAGLAATDRRYNIVEEQAVVDQAEADVVNAQHAFDATIMHSSFSGTVGRINAGVGQLMNASYNTFSPSTASPRAGSGGKVAPQPGPGALIVLNNVHSYQLMLPFSQADVARMRPNQPAEVSVEAIPGLTRKGLVTSIEPTQATLGGDPKYLVTVVLTELDPSLKDGLTAQAHLVLSSIDNALIVPTSAVRGSGDGRTGTVCVLQSDGTRRDVPVRLGVIGKDTSQVLSGLREGDQVVLGG